MRTARWSSIRWSPLLVLGLLLPARPAWSQFLAPTTRDSVSAVVSGGAASVLVPPDRAILYVALAARDSAGPAAAAALATGRDRVLRALAPLGLGAEQVTPWGVGYGRDSGPGGMRPGSPSSLITAKLGLRVVVDRLDRLDAVLAALARSGVEGVQYAAFESTRDADARRTATERALAEARLQAETMARAAGGQLGELLGVSTFPEFAGGVSAAERFFAFSQGDRGVTLSPNDVAVRVAVSASWRFVPGRQ